MPINPGLLDRRITLQSRTESRDNEGSAVTTFADETQIWAQKVSENSAEARRLLATRSGAEIVFRIRYRASLTSAHRIYFDGRYYDIVGDPTEDTSHARHEAMLVAARYTAGGAT